MNVEERPSLLIRIFGPLFFSMLAMLSVIWFFGSMVALVSDLMDSQPVITFNKGAMYMFGAGISLTFLSVGVIYNSLYSRKVPENLESILIRGAIIGLVIMCTFPQVTHFSINIIIEKRQYVSCEEAEYRWLLYKKYVYTKSHNTCSQLVDK